MKRAVHTMHHSSIAERDFSNIMLCFDPENMDEAKRLIREFRRNFRKALPSTLPKEERLYSLAVQFFPLDRKSVCG